MQASLALSGKRSKPVLWPCVHALLNAVFRTHLTAQQLHRPFVKPLVLLTPKYLLHHRPATSALVDFSVGTFFNRVIDDGKVRILVHATHIFYTRNAAMCQVYMIYMIATTVAAQGSATCGCPSTS